MFEDRAHFNIKKRIPINVCTWCGSRRDDGVEEVGGGLATGRGAPEVQPQDIVQGVHGRRQATH